MAKKAKPAPEGPQAQLSKAQTSYLEANDTLPVDQAAADTGLSVAQVQAYREQTASRRKSWFDKNLGRPAQGVVVMTEASSSISDDVSKMGVITQDMIERAKAADKLDLAQKLIDLRNQQRSDRDTETRAKNADRWHFLDR